MMELGDAFTAALALIVNFEKSLAEIVMLSLQVSLIAVALACLVGLPIGAALAIFRFPGRLVVTVILNAMMGLPPVVVGLIVYLILSRSGPLGTLGLLYTPTAMIIAQFFLIMPIIVSLTRQSLEEMIVEYDDLLKSLKANTKERMLTILWDSRYSLLTYVLAGLGRSLSEVGAIIIVGGNIAYATRVMTTTIALETSKGNLEIAIALGFVLIFISFLINLLAYLLNNFAKRFSYD
mgnify:CR=1 FL=1